jgi:hypothetical protein
MALPFNNGGLKFILSLFLTSLLVPLLAAAIGYGSLLGKMESIEKIYATEVELEYLRGDVKVIRSIIENSSLVTPEIRNTVNDLQRQINERNRRLALGYPGTNEKNTSP